MTIEDILREYEQQSQALSHKIEALQATVHKYHSADLYLLQKRIKAYKTLKDECDKVITALNNYYKEE